MANFFPKNILIIAGLDPSGNAGLLRDAGIFQKCGLRVSAVATALTAQNKNRFLAAQTMSTIVFKNQMNALLPLSRFQAVKIGMLGNEKIVQTLVSILKKEKRKPPIVLDPVLESTTGGVLLTPKGRKKLWEELIGQVSVWTPNLAEASYFYGKKIRTDAELERAGEWLYQSKKIPVLIKGKKSKNKIIDYFTDGTYRSWFVYPFLRLKNLRGTGCLLSSLIASHLAMGSSLEQAIVLGKEDIAGLLNEADSGSNGAPMRPSGPHLPRDPWPG